jgi:ubiquinol-cytochrome c reductase cytochrome c1 subunit
MRAALATLLLVLAAPAAPAGEDALASAGVSMDASTLVSGARAVMTNCRGCHALKYLRYRDLADLGIDRADIDAWRGDQPLSAPLVAMMAEEDAIRAFGAAPPDLSLMVLARDGRADYVYSYLLAYRKAGDDLVNRVYPATKMPDALGISSASDAAQSRDIAAQARDIVSFLQWAADPHALERKRLGAWVIGYLAVLTTLLYFLKRRIWSRLG